MAAMRQACGVQARPSLADRVLMIGIQYLLLSGLHEPDKQQGESPNATHNKTHEYIMSISPCQKKKECRRIGLVYNGLY